MSAPSIAPFLPFRRVRIGDQRVQADPAFAVVGLESDRRFVPRCAQCGGRADSLPLPASGAGSEPGHPPGPPPAAGAPSVVSELQRGALGGLRLRGPLCPGHPTDGTLHRRSLPDPLSGRSGHPPRAGLEAGEGLRQGGLARGGRRDRHLGAPADGGRRDRPAQGRRVHDRGRGRRDRAGGLDGPGPPRPPWGRFSSS